MLSKRLPHFFQSFSRRQSGKTTAESEQCTTDIDYDALETDEIEDTYDEDDKENDQDWVFEHKTDNMCRYKLKKTHNNINYELMDI